MDFNKYNFTTGHHKNKAVIWIDFTYNSILKNDLRQRFPSAKYSGSQKKWYLPDLNSIREIVKIPFKSPIEKHLKKLPEVNHNALIDMYNLLLIKKYSLHTIRTYISEFAAFLYLIDKHPADSFNENRIKDYFIYVLKKHKLSEAKLNGRINALKFYYEQVRQQPRFFINIPRPKKPQLLPGVISKRGVKKLFSVCKNKKHLLMLKLTYGMGLRVSEIVNIAVQDIDTNRMQVHIKCAKGKKDRYVNLPESILENLKDYYKLYKPKHFLFEGKYGGKYSISSAQKVFKKQLNKAGINKKIGIHGLRHSYATHLMEAGANMRFIQELLGHNSIKTTQVYTKVSQISKQNIKSPLDSL